MSLTYEQRYLLEELREYLRRVEKMAPSYPFDLDDYAVEYGEIGYPWSHAINGAVHEKAAARKEVFENSGPKEKIEIYLRDEEY